MERRSFLKGLLVSVSAGTAMVKLATPAETQALVVAGPVLLGQPECVVNPYGIYPGDDVFVRRSTGEFDRIGFLRTVTVTANISDLTTFDGEIQLVPDQRDARATFDGGWL